MNPIHLMNAMNRPDFAKGLRRRSPSVTIWAAVTSQRCGLTAKGTVNERDSSSGFS